MESFQRAGYRFDVHDSGASSAETVVLLHGFPQQPVAFKQVLPPLRAAGLRTLVPSQRGYTATARPTARRSYRSDETVADVVALLDAAGVAQAHIVGHDWGGFQAWGLAAWHPDRVGSLTVLSTPHPSALKESFTASNQALRSWYMALYQLPFIPEAFAQSTLARTLRNTDLPPEYVGHYCDTMAERGTLTGALNWYRGIPYSRRAIGPITVPTTYVWGGHDFALGRVAAERTEKYVHASYEFRELDAGHWLPETHPEAVAEAVLTRVRG